VRVISLVRLRGFACACKHFYLHKCERCLYEMISRDSRAVVRSRGTRRSFEAIKTLPLIRLANRKGESSRSLTSRLPHHRQRGKTDESGQARRQTRTRISDERHGNGVRGISTSVRHFPDGNVDFRGTLKIYEQSTRILVATSTRAYLIVACRNRVTFEIVRLSQNYVSPSSLATLEGPN